MRNKPAAREHLSDQQRDELIAFLRDWLPEEAKQVYRDMIRSAPHTWWRHPHFDDGIILDHALRGNGYTEKALNVRSLQPLWPDLLARAVIDDEARRRESTA